MDNLLNEYIDTYKNPNCFIDKSPDEIKLSFSRSPKVEIIGDESSDNDPYTVHFIDRKTNKTLCVNTINKNHWLATNEKYYVDWIVKVFKRDTLVLEHELDITGENVFIAIDSKSIGDTIAWVPQVEEFRKKHNCHIYLSTFHNNLFRKSYPKLDFIEPNGNRRDLSFKYEWWMGVYLENGANFHRRDWRTLSLFDIGSDQLGLESREIKCKIDIPQSINKKIIPNKKYVCITTSSTAGLKHWQNETGWQEVVDHLNNLGYQVVLVQKEKLPWMDLKKLEGVTHPKTRNLQEVIGLLLHCEFVVGLSSGISWLAWALDKKVVMISGFTKPFHEFSNPHRIINEDVCHGCWHDTEYMFDRSNWKWCPRNKNFECTKSITSDKVIREISKLV